MGNTLVYGVGINDLKYKENTKSQKEYRTWTDLLKRLYDEKYLKRYPSYRSVSVDNTWLVYSKFRDDVRGLKNSEMLKEGWVLDKDICSNTKLYSKETCCIVPQQVNIFFSSFSTKHNPAYDARCGMYYCYCCFYGVKTYLGRYKTIEESHKVYLNYKIFVVEDMIDKYEGVLDCRVIGGLLECREALKSALHLL